MAEQTGPLMVRHIIDGHEVLLPADCTLVPPYPKGLTDKETAKWLEEELKKPLGGTWR